MSEQYHDPHTDKRYYRWGRCPVCGEWLEQNAAGYGGGTDSPWYHAEPTDCPGPPFMLPDPDSITDEYMG